MAHVGLNVKEMHSTQGWVIRRVDKISWLKVRPSLRFDKLFKGMLACRQGAGTGPANAPLTFLTPLPLAQLVMGKDGKGQGPVSRVSWDCHGGCIGVSGASASIL
eukprot:scaffold47681_cov13-Tisochrysis_lutea.AAC.1